MADPSLVTLCITHNAKIHVNGLSGSEQAALQEAISRAWPAGYVGTSVGPAGGFELHLQGQPFRSDTMPYLASSRRMLLSALGSLYASGLTLWAAARTTNKLSDLDTLVFRRMATTQPGPTLSLSIDAYRGVLMFVGDIVDTVMVEVAQALQAVAQVDRCGRSNVAGDVYEMQLAPNPFNSPKASGSVQSALVVAEMLYALHTNGYPLCATVNLSQTDKSPDTFLFASFPTRAGLTKTLPPSYKDATRPACKTT